MGLCHAWDAGQPCIYGAAEQLTPAAPRALASLLDHGRGWTEFGSKTALFVDFSHQHTAPYILRTAPRPSIALWWQQELKAMQLAHTKTRSYHRKTMPWWYDRIIDEMIANPGVKLSVIAQRLGRKPSTISSIINTDMFKAHYNARRARYAMQHDIGILEKTAKVAHQSLDLISQVLDKKKDQVPLDMLKDIADSSLKRMGYGVEPPPGAVNINVNNGQQVVLPPTVSKEDLLQAQMAVRQVQETKLAENKTPLLELKAEEKE